MKICYDKKAIGHSSFRLTTAEIRKLWSTQCKISLFESLFHSYFAIIKGLDLGTFQQIKRNGGFSEHFDLKLPDDYHANLFLLKTSETNYVLRQP